MPDLATREAENFLARVHDDPGGRIFLKCSACHSVEPVFEDLRSRGSRSLGLDVVRYTRGQDQELLGTVFTFALEDAVLLIKRREVLREARHAFRRAQKKNAIRL